MSLQFRNVKLLCLLNFTRNYLNLKMSSGGTVKTENSATANGEESRKRTSPVDDDQEDSSDRRIGKPSRRKRAKVSENRIGFFTFHQHSFSYIRTGLPGLNQ